MNSKRIPAFAVALTMLVSIFAFTPAASAYSRARVGVRVYAPLPPFRHERVLVRPGPRYVWVPGHWQPYHRRYVWVQGAWLVPPHPRAIWVAPRVVYRHQRHHRNSYYYRGYWRY